MSEKPPLDAVLLDAGGTLARLDFEWMAAELAAVGVDADVAVLRRAEVAGRRRFDEIRDVRVYFAAMLQAAGVPAAHLWTTLDRFAGRQSGPGLWVRPAEGARAALDALTGLGLRCAVISNSDGRAEEHLRDCGLARGLEFVLDSHRVGVEKPDPAIFRAALERLGVAAGRALYVGDIRSVDEAGAAAAGMHFVLLDPYGDYAASGTPAVSGIERVPEWVAERFAPPSARGAFPSRDGMDPIAAGPPGGATRR